MQNACNSGVKKIWNCNIMCEFTALQLFFIPQLNFSIKTIYINHFSNLFDILKLASDSIVRDLFTIDSL